jgi:hypothetical protein
MTSFWIDWEALVIKEKEIITKKAKMAEKQYYQEKPARKY